MGDLHAIALANQICNEYGLDTIGTGATIAWAMECFENGLLTEEDLGFRARSATPTAMVRLADMIATRGRRSATCWRRVARAADLIGKGHEYLITVKGAEAPAHMPQAKQSLGVIYAVNPFGADHQSSEHDPNIEEGAGDLLMERQALLGFTEPMPYDSLDAEKVRYASGPSCSTRSWTPPRSASSCGAPRGSSSGRRRPSTSSRP